MPTRTVQPIGTPSATSVIDKAASATTNHPVPIRSDCERVWVMYHHGSPPEGMRAI